MSRARTTPRAPRRGAEGSGEPPAEAVAAPRGRRPARPGITGRSDPRNHRNGRGRRVPEPAPRRPAGRRRGPRRRREGPAQASADAGDGHAESRTEGPDGPGSGSRGPSADAEPDAERPTSRAERPKRPRPTQSDARAPDEPARPARRGRIDAAAAAQVKAEASPPACCLPGSPPRSPSPSRTRPPPSSAGRSTSCASCWTSTPAPPPSPPTPQRRRRRLLPLLLAVLVAAALVAAVAVVVTSGGDDDGDPPHPRPGADGRPSPPATRGMPAPLTPGPRHRAGQPARASRRPARCVVVRLAGDETLHITEQAILPEPATAQIPLALSDVRRLGGEIAALRPQVTRAARLPRRQAGRRCGRRAPAAGSSRCPARPTTGRRSATGSTGAVIVDPEPSETRRASASSPPLLGRGLVRPRACR